MERLPLHVCNIIIEYIPDNYLLDKARNKKINQQFQRIWRNFSHSLSVFFNNERLEACDIERIIEIQAEHYRLIRRVFYMKYLSCVINQMCYYIHFMKKSLQQVPIDEQQHFKDLQLLFKKQYLEHLRYMNERVIVFDNWWIGLL
jgi:hypothetical protein